MAQQEVVRQFDKQAERYDNWYRDSALFTLELAALRAIKERLPRPGLEIGVGPGRFAQALKTEFGLDPAISPLHLAAQRSIMSVNGVGEHLPIRTEAIGTAFVLFTLCFLDDPAAVLRECSRVLAPDGRMVLGFIPRFSPWGKRYAARGKDDHPLYRYARFRTVAETVSLLNDNGLYILESWSTLLQPSGQDLQAEMPQSGSRDDAGFCVLVAGKNGEYL